MNTMIQRSFEGRLFSSGETRDTVHVHYLTLYQIPHKNIFVKMDEFMVYNNTLHDINEADPTALIERSRNYKHEHAQRGGGVRFTCYIAGVNDIFKN